MRDDRNHIMIDLECLDSGKDAAIVSIGAVQFSLSKLSLGLQFYREISLKSIEDQVKHHGRTMSLQTMKWWMNQPDAVRKVIAKPDHPCTIERALQDFAMFCGKHAIVWGNGVDYDNVVLRNCYKAYEIKCPWTFRNQGCFRTVKGLFPAQIKRVGAHHNGLDDAITQANYMLTVWAKLHKEDV